MSLAPRIEFLICSRASSYCSSAHPSFSHSAKGIWMARIGGTFTADQQFDPFTRMPSLPHRSLYRACTPPAQYNRVRRTGALFASSLLWQSARRLWSGPSLSAMKSSLCLDMVGDCRWRDAASFPAEPTQRLDTQLMRFNPRSRRADRRIRRRSAVWLCGVSRSASCATAHCRRFRLRELRRIDTYYRVSTPMTKHSFCVLDDTRQMKAKAPGQH
jgi:hypothetical protein